MVKFNLNPARAASGGEQMTALGFWLILAIVLSVAAFGWLDYFYQKNLNRGNNET